MKAVVVFGALTLLTMSGTASAQPYPSESTTTSQTAIAPAMPTPPAAAPPVGTLSSTQEQHAVDANGNKFDKRQTTYRNSQGIAEDSQTTTTTRPPPPPPPVSTTTTTTQSTTAIPQ